MAPSTSEQQVDLQRPWKLHMATGEDTSFASSCRRYFLLKSGSIKKIKEQKILNLNYTFEFLCLILKKQTREKQLQNLFRFILFYTKNYQKVANMPRGQRKSRRLQED